MAAVSQMVLAADGSYSPTGVEVTPTMTTNTAPAGYTASSSTELDASATAYKAFDKSLADYTTGTFITNVATGWCRLQFPTAVYVASYKITARAVNMTQSPKDWTFQYSDDGSAWTTVDTRTGSTGWGANEERSFTITGPHTPHAYWRINCSANDGGSFFAMAELKMFG